MERKHFISFESYKRGTGRGAAQIEMIMLPFPEATDIEAGLKVITLFAALFCKIAVITAAIVSRECVWKIQEGGSHYSLLYSIKVLKK